MGSESPLPEPYYQDDLITLYHGDCREIMPHINADVLITDPPYGVNFAGKATKWKAATEKNRIAGGYASGIDTPEAVRATAIPLVEKWVSTGKPAAVTPGNRMMWEYPAPAALGCLFYPSGAGMSSWGFQCSQPIMFYGKDPYLANRMGSRPNGKWETGNAGTENHPCPKPLETMRWLVQRTCVGGETIVDPFAGSGTTLRAAKDMGFHAVGIEIEREYCDVIVQRLAQEVLL